MRIHFPQPHPRDEASNVANAAMAEDVRPYDGDENTDGAECFPKAIRAAQALASLVEPPDTPTPATYSSRPSPLVWQRVAVLLGAVALIWLVRLLAEAPPS